MRNVAINHPTRQRRLPEGITVADVAELSREALVAFLELQRRQTIARADLSAWVLGAYADAIAIGQHERRGATPSVVMAAVAPEEDVAARVAQTTRAIHRVLVAFHAAPDPSVAARLTAREIVEPVVDARDDRGYAPLASAAMPLTLRVLAVAAVEMLSRPERLRADLVVSGESVEILARPIASGVGIRQRQTVPWTPPRGDRESSPGWPARGPTLAELAAAADEEA